MAAIWLSSLVLGHSATTLLQQGFDGAAGDTNPVFYGGNGNAGGSSPVVAANAVSTGMSGNGLKFSGSSGNSLVAANFAPVTLANAGDYITFSANYAATVLPANGTVQIGLLNSNGTLLAGPMFGVAGNSYDDYGYRVDKNMGNGITTNDVSTRKETATVGGTPTTAGGLSSPTTLSLGTSSSNLSGYNLTMHTVSLKLELAANGTDLVLTYMYDTYSLTRTLTGADILTTTFDELMFAPGSGSNAAPYVDNFLVTTNVVPEPGSLALMIAGGFGLLAFRQRRGVRNLI